MTREEAIKMLKSKMDGHTDTSYEWAETVRMAIKALEQEPKMGKWIYRKEEDSYRCNLCTFPCHKDNLGAIPTEYCAGCGAKMSEISTGSESEE